MAYSDIKDPSAHFQTTLYTGNGSTQSITNSGNSDLKPDFIWTKSRSDNGGHAVQNSNVGAGQQIYPYLAYQEETVSGVSAFLTNGFSLGSNGTSNANNVTHVAWQWKANGGTTVSNTDGDITTTVQANTDAGFSIVTYTGSGTNDTKIGHGLGVTLDMMIVKNRDDAENWEVFHKDLNAASPEDYRMSLNLTDAATYYSNLWGTTTRTSTTIAVKAQAGVNLANTEFVAFCFASKQGYSKFGSYIGNGSADGPFVYTGFKPAFVLIKRTDSADNWFLYDTKRSPFNEADEYIRANITNFEGSNNFQIDMLSNGFKTRNSGTFIGALNASGGTYIYMTFAENPFVAGGIPTTAR